MVRTIPAKLARVGKKVRLVVAPAHGTSSRRRDPALIKLIVKAGAARTAVEQSSQESIEAIARSRGHTRDHFKVLLQLSYFAPDVTAAIHSPERLPRRRHPAPVARKARTVLLPNDGR